MIISTSFAGIVFAIFSGQPLNIIGVTGPLLVFEENLYKVRHVDDVNYIIIIVIEEKITAEQQQHKQR